MSPLESIDDELLKAEDRLACIDLEISNQVEIERQTRLLRQPADREALALSRIGCAIEIKE